TEFQVVHHRLKRGKEVFVGNQPCGTGRGEKSKTVVFVETLTTVVTEVKFRKIAAVIGVRQTTRQTEVTLRQGQLERAGIGHKGFPCLEYQEAADVVFSDILGIVPATFKIEGRVLYPVAGKFSITQIFGTYAGFDQFVVTGQTVVVIDFIVERRIGPVDSELRQTAYIEHSPYG